MHRLLATVLGCALAAACSSTSTPTPHAPGPWPEGAEATVERQGARSIVTWPDASVDAYRVEHSILEVHHGGGWIHEDNEFEVRFQHAATVEQPRYETAANPSGLEGHQYLVRYDVVALEGGQEVGRLTAWDHLFASR